MPSSSKHRRSNRQFRYGAKPTWEIVLDATLSFDRPASAVEISDLITSAIPDFAKANVFPDLSVLSVNSPSRGNYGVNRAPRRSDSGNSYDRLIRIGHGKGVLYTQYDPHIHGVWELVNVGDKVLRPRFAGGADQAEVREALEVETARGMFDVSEDARRRTVGAIVQRDGQPAFRQALLLAYGGRCAISGCAVAELLEAAHIVPYRGAHTNVVANGLLLRADWHKLFDLHLFCIDPETLRIRLGPDLKRSDYRLFEGRTLRRPERSTQTPYREALELHGQRCGWIHAGPNGAPLDEDDA